MGNNKDITVIASKNQRSHGHDQKIDFTQTLFEGIIEIKFVF